MNTRVLLDELVAVDRAARKIRTRSFGELGFEFLEGWVDTQVRGAWCAVAEPLEICCDHAHRRQRYGQLGERRRLKGAALDGEQLERLRDIGNRLGTDRFVRDQQRRQLGDLRERVANVRGIGGGETGGDAGGTKWPCGVRSDARQCLRKFQGF